MLTLGALFYHGMIECRHRRTFSNYWKKLHEHE